MDSEHTLNFKVQAEVPVPPAERSCFCPEGVSTFSGALSARSLGADSDSALAARCSLHFL